MTSVSCRAFTLLELLAVVAVVLILAALLSPVAGRFVGKANGAKCLSNLKTIGSASANYSGDHNGSWPPCSANGPVFANALIPYLERVPRVNDSDFLNSPLVCPGARTDEPDGNYRHRGIYTASYQDPNSGVTFKYGLSYGQNVYAPGNGDSYAVPKRVLAEAPSKMMLYMDNEGHHIVSVGGLAAADRRRWLLQRHNEKINVAYADGSVRTLAIDEIPPSNAPIRQFWSGKGKSWPD